MFKGLKSLLAGVVAGTAVGILFAPKKGDETRKNIKKEVDDGGTGLNSIKDTLVKMGKDLGETCKDIYEEVNEKESVQKAKKTAKSKAKKIINERVPADKRKKVKAGVKKAKKAINKAARRVADKTK